MRPKRGCTGWVFRPTDGQRRTRREQRILVQIGGQFSRIERARTLGSNDFALLGGWRGRPKEHHYYHDCWEKLHVGWTNFPSGGYVT